MLLEKRKRKKSFIFLFAVIHTKKGKKILTNSLKTQQLCIKGHVQPPTQATDFTTEGKRIRHKTKSAASSHTYQLFDNYWATEISVQRFLQKDKKWKGNCFSLLSTHIWMLMNTALSSLDKHVYTASFILNFWVASKRKSSYSILLCIYLYHQLSVISTLSP